jgi:hypothetical protein
MNSPAIAGVRVILAFSAHEPLCEPRRRVHSPLGRLVATAEALDAPLTLALSNELAHQLRRELPETFATLQRGYAERWVRPLYTPAHRAPARLLSTEELYHELTLNEECVHGLFGAPRPERRGVLLPGGPSQAMIDARLIPALEERGADFTLCPAHAGRPARRPFRIGERLVALPLCDAALPPDRDASLTVLRTALSAAQPGDVLTFLCELEQLELLALGWGQLRTMLPGLFELTAPEELLQRDEATPPWLPELRLDDQVPADELHGWEGGRFLAEVLEWLCDAFGFPRTPPISAEALFEEDYRLERLPPRAQVPMLLRLAKAGCAAGIDEDEGAAKRPYLHGFRLCDALVSECRLADTRPDAPGALAPPAIAQLGRMAELLVDPRVAWHQAELERLRDELGARTNSAFTELDGARGARQRAGEELAMAQAAYAELADQAFHGRARWRAFVTHLRDHLGAVCVALDHLERASAAPAETPARYEAIR